MNYDKKNPKTVEALFDDISPIYDGMNNLISGFLQHGVKRRTVEAIRGNPKRILDVCCGTGDITFAEAAKYPFAEVYGVDISAGMLKIAQKRLFAGRTDRAATDNHSQRDGHGAPSEGEKGSAAANPENVCDGKIAPTEPVSSDSEDKNLSSVGDFARHNELDADDTKFCDSDENIVFKRANAANLPFEDGFFDVCTVVFGLRNMPDPEAAIAELARVLKDGGQLVITEFGAPRGWFKAIFAIFLRLLPFAGLITGKYGAYRYLAESISTYEPPEKITQYLRSAGFEDAKNEELLFGAISLQTGTKTEKTL